jgi:hypothetical protein
MKQEVAAAWSVELTAVCAANLPVDRLPAQRLAASALDQADRHRPALEEPMLGGKVLDRLPVAAR